MPPVATVVALVGLNAPAAPPSSVTAADRRRAGIGVRAAAAKYDRAPPPLSAMTRPPAPLIAPEYVSALPSESSVLVVPVPSVVALETTSAPPACSVPPSSVRALALSSVPVVTSRMPFVISTGPGVSVCARQSPNSGGVSSVELEVAHVLILRAEQRGY